MTEITDATIATGPAVTVRLAIYPESPDLTVEWMAAPPAEQIAAVVACLMAEYRVQRVAIQESATRIRVAIDQSEDDVRAAADTIARSYRPGWHQTVESPGVTG